MPGSTSPPPRRRSADDVRVAHTLRVLSGQDCHELSTGMIMFRASLDRASLEGAVRAAARDRSQCTAPSLRDMRSDEMPKPPSPVVTAVAINGLLAAFPVVMAIWFVTGRESAGAVVALFALMPGLTAYGLWQGNRGARVVAICEGALIALLGLRTADVTGLSATLVGLLLILLLAGPGSSRAWFTPDP